jgi:hypothetical protein
MLSKLLKANKSYSKPIKVIKSEIFFSAPVRHSSCGTPFYILHTSIDI